MGWVVNATPRPLYPRERDPVPIVGGPQGWSGLLRKISPPPGIDPWTFQPVASGYQTTQTDEISHILQLFFIYRNF
jgi:hypothetical protein